MVVVSVWGQTETPPVDVVASPGGVLAEAVSNDDTKTIDDHHLHRHGDHEFRHANGHVCGHADGHVCGHGLEHHHHRR